jgi:hypothetical protein
MSTTTAHGLTALCGSLVAVVAIIISLRFYTRGIQKVGFGIDDWMILPSFLSFVGMVACALIGIHLKQFGYSDKESQAAQLSFKSQASLVVSLDVLSAASLGFTRISALLFYRRIFCVSGRTKTLRAIIHASIVITSLWMVAFIILPPLQCGPDLSVWSAPAAVRKLHCTMGRQIILSFAISDLILEAAVIATPMIPVSRLHASFRRRFAVFCVFLTAFVSLAAVIARLVMVVNTQKGKVGDKSRENTTETFMWVLEAGFALIAVNLPTLWWLRTRIPAERILSSMRSVISLQSLRSHGSGGASRGRNSQHTRWNGQDTAKDTYELDRQTTTSQEQVAK